MSCIPLMPGVDGGSSGAAEYYHQPANQTITFSDVTRVGIHDYTTSTPAEVTTLATMGVVSNGSTAKTYPTHAHRDSELYEYIESLLYTRVVVVICAFGLLGNILNDYFGCEARA